MGSTTPAFLTMPLECQLLAFDIFEALVRGLRVDKGGQPYVLSRIFEGKGTTQEETGGFLVPYRISQTACLLNPDPLLKESTNIHKVFLADFFSSNCQPDMQGKTDAQQAKDWEQVGRKVLHQVAVRVLKEFSALGSALRTLRQDELRLKSIFGPEKRSEIVQNPHLGLEEEQKRLTEMAMELAAAGQIFLNRAGALMQRKDWSEEVYNKLNDPLLKVWPAGSLESVTGMIEFLQGYPR
jgi:hypothetical protein